jgi:hypothetical protein
VDQACAGRCLNASTGSSSISALSTCMTSGPGASCAACGDGDAGLGGILNENCAADLDASDTCVKCLHEKCCETRANCLNDPRCLILATCETRCRSGLPDDAGATAEPPDGGYYSCDLWCSAPTNRSLGKWAEYLACGDILCSGGPACAGANSCTVCVSQYCENEQLAVSATSDGYLFGNCIAQCATSDTVCEQKCTTSYSGAQGPAAEFEACVGKYCAECQ